MLILSTGILSFLFKPGSALVAEDGKLGIDKVMYYPAESFSFNGNFIRIFCEKVQDVLLAKVDFAVGFFFKDEIYEKRRHAFSGI